MKHPLTRSRATKSDQVCNWSIQQASRQIDHAIGATRATWYWSKTVLTWRELIGSPLKSPAYEILLGT